MLSKSLYFETYGTNYLLLLGSLVASVYGIFHFQRYYMNRTLVVYNVISLILLTINLRSELSTIVAIAAAINISFVIVHVIRAEEFFKGLIKVTTWLAILSWSKFLILFYGLGTPFTFESVNGDIYNNYIICGILTGDHTAFDVYRNNGLWYEAGAFALILNISYLFAYLYGIISPKITLIIGLTILSTLSTAGVISFMLILMFNLGIKKSVFYLSIVGALILVVYPQFFVSVFSKFDLSHPSTSSRFNDLTFALKVLRGEPFGIGFGGSLLDLYVQRYSIGTLSNTFASLLMYGGLQSILLLAPMFFPTKKVGAGTLLLYIAVIILLFSSQSIYLWLIFWVINNYNMKRFRVV